MQQRRHAFLHGTVANVDHAAPGLDDLGDAWGGHQEFMDTNTPFIADVTTFGTADGAIDLKVLIVFNPQLIKRFLAVS